VLALAGCGAGVAAPEAPDDGVVRVGFLAACGRAAPALGARGPGGRACPGPLAVRVVRACPAEVDRARKLVEGDRVDVVLAYPDDDQGFALALYAQTQADITFLDGSSGIPATTLDVQAANYFRFAPDGRQRAAGLGTYAYRELAERRLRLAADAYARDAFTVELCALGGEAAGAPRSLPVRARPRYADATRVLRRVLADGGLDGLRDRLARGLDENRQAVVDVDILRGGRVVATFRGVEQTFGGAFSDEDEVDYRPPCERREPPAWAR
jgi:hypothetical protein